MIRNWRGQAESDAIFQARIQKRRTSYLVYRLLKSTVGILIIDVPKAVIARQPISRLEARLFKAYRLAYIRQLIRIVCSPTSSMSASPESDAPA